MKKLFNQRLLYLIPTMFLIVLIFKIYFNYENTKQYTYDFAKKEAQVLALYSMSHRNYYQELYISDVLRLNEKTFLGLPSYSSSIISNIFSKNNILNIQVKSVSDRARNPINQADKLELKAIEYLKSHKDKKEYFNNSDEKVYQFARVLKIEKKCLSCHGKKEKAPLFIQKKYDRAYGYKLGDVRGIISIKLPKDKIDDYFIKHFAYSSLYDILMLLFLFIIVYFLTQKVKKVNTILEEEVNQKTSELKRTLMYDGLTNLPNRFSLIKDIDSENCEKTKHLAIINIDRFKDINDLYGFSFGDKLLKKIATILNKSKIKDSCKVYKLPSDEFAVLSKKDITKDEFIEKVDTFILSIQKYAHKLEDITVFINLACGVVSGKKNLLIKADMAIKMAKSSGKALVVYNNSLDRKEAIIKNMAGIILINNAIQNDNIVPYFQPIYDLDLKKTTKYETLVRIIDENGSVISPVDFLDISHKAKLYPYITRTMIEKTFEFFKDKEFEFSINLSIEDIVDKQMHDFIIERLSRYSNSSRVVFEILETEKIEDYIGLNHFIKKLKYYGCKVAIDDFGKGYSNFAHILELDIDYLKIDASLVKNILTDKNSSKIVQTIVVFAQNLDIKTIAEYVENKEVLESLDSMGVDFIQGYYIGKPQSKLI